MIKDAYVLDIIYYFVHENMIHPPVIVLNFRRGHYEWGIDLSAAVRGELCIVRP
jgi:hypothetical protein